MRAVCVLGSAEYEQVLCRFHAWKSGFKQYSRISGADYGTLFIKSVGLGAFAGILALGFHSIGMLGKLFGESIENMNFSAREALIASGANRIQVLWFAILPEVMPAFMSYTLYRFEISVRSAAILGIVGAGGIGAPLIFALNGHSWDRVGIILWGIIIMVTIIDYISGSIRKRLI